MEVTRANFTEAFEYIKAWIHSADLISFDTEFSGYSAWKQDRGHEYDMLEERYDKHNILHFNWITLLISQ